MNTKRERGKRDERKSGEEDQRKGKDKEHNTRNESTTNERPKRLCPPKLNQRTTEKNQNYPQNHRSPTDSPKRPLLSSSYASLQTTAFWPLYTTPSPPSIPGRVYVSLTRLEYHDSRARELKGPRGEACQDGHAIRRVCRQLKPARMI